MEAGEGWLSIEEACVDGIVCFETMNPHLFVETNEDEDGADAARTVVVLKPSVDAIITAMRVRTRSFFHAEEISQEGACKNASGD
jgi:putative hydrolase of the HAD superfamily